MKTSKVKRFVCGALAAQGIVAVYGNSSSPAASSNLSDLGAFFGNASGSAANLLDEETKKALGEAEKAIHEFGMGCVDACVKR